MGKFQFLNSLLFLHIGSCILFCLQAVSIAEIPAIKFVNVTKEAGIDFAHFSGAFGQRYMPETMGAGCGFLDFDNDGLLDIIFINGKEWKDDQQSNHTPVLYRNLGNGKFIDVTRSARINTPMYGMGVTIADYDNDNDADLYFTNLGANFLFCNNGDGTFTDVTSDSDTAGDDWSTSALFFDYDRNGWLDLFVCNYVEWSIESDLSCTVDQQHRSYCTPSVYTGQSCRLYQGKNGVFEDVTVASGILNPDGKSLGVTMLDYDNDSWIDLAVANDTEANFLYHNNGDGTFTDEAVLMGVAFDENGKAQGSMGIDTADIHNDGNRVMAIGNFSNEMTAFYHASPGGYFSDQTIQAKVGNASLFTLTFGLFFFDYDQDGYQDLFCVNGHIEPNVQRYQKNLRYSQCPSLFWNQQNGDFYEVGVEAGLKDFGVGRGAAYGDYDGDGDLDVLVSNNGVVADNGQAWLLRNDNEENNNYLRLKTKGTQSNRDGIGAKITISVDGQRQSRLVKTGSSYCSQSEMVSTFGLGQSEEIEQLTVVWPSGLIDTYTNILANSQLTLQEGETQR